MGASAAIGIKQDAVEQSAFVELINDKSKMKVLFMEIVHSQEEGRINLKNRISIGNLLRYFRNDNPKLHPVFKSWSKQAEVMIEAHKHSVIAKDKEHLPQKRFKLLLKTMYLFSHLWTIFDMSDCMVEDKKVYLGEYVAAKRILCDHNTVFDFSAISDEDWAAEFRELDKDGGGYISFGEMCKYSVKRLASPSDFVEAGTENDSEDEEEKTAKIQAEVNAKFTSVSSAVDQLEAMEKAAHEATAAKMKAIHEEHAAAAAAAHPEASNVAVAASTPSAPTASTSESVATADAGTISQGIDDAAATATAAIK